MAAMKSIDAAEGAATVLERAARATRDEVQRARAIDAAGLLANAKHVERISAYAKSKEFVVAAAAVRAVARLGNDASVRKSVLDVLDDALARRGDKKHFHAYAAAIEGLGRIDVPARRNVARPQTDKPVPRATNSQPTSVAAERPLGPMIGCGNAWWSSDPATMPRTNSNGGG